MVWMAARPGRLARPQLLGHRLDPQPPIISIKRYDMMFCLVRIDLTAWAEQKGFSPASERIESGVYRGGKLRSEGGKSDSHIE
jgi:hypothetical protein